MKVIYDRETDSLTIIFAESPIAESDEDRPGLILDYDDKGNLVSLEILDASQQVDIPSKVDVVIKEVDELRGMNPFDTQIQKARRQAKRAGLKQRDTTSAVAKARGSKCLQVISKRFSVVARRALR